ncbi:MAG: family 1 encapsulin nanocompartment shell protein [Tissierellia bacterium]|nr:family 1 encapsulin nanocompartment shell protein [Tissierellia bacterium]
MDLLKRSIAPITEEAWNEIDDAAVDVINAKLTGRRVLKVQGPYGFEKNSVDEGRLVLFDDDSDVQKGSYKLRNLIEARVEFELPKWELDNIERGAKDLDLDPLEEAVEKLCQFEDDLIYNGYKKAASEGMKEVAANTLDFGKEGNEILKNISDATLLLEDAYGEKPYALVVSEELYDRLNIVFDGKYLIDVVKELIGGKIVRTDHLEGGLLFPERDEDFELTIGQDYSIGYQADDVENVRLFITESLAFRVLDEDKIVAFK